MYELTSLAMLLRASSSAENGFFKGARFRPAPCVPMLPLELKPHQEVKGQQKKKKSASVRKYLWMENKHKNFKSTGLQKRPDIETFWYIYMDSLIQQHFTGNYLI